MTTRDDILSAMEDLVLTTGRRPSLAAIAARVGLTKQGVLHHFPHREALDGALLEQSIARIDREMREAQRAGACAETWLRLSAPTTQERALGALLLSLLGPASPDDDIVATVTQAFARWEAMIDREVGDARLAEVIRLVGDGLFSEALLTGTPPAAERVDALVAHLVGSRAGDRTS